MPSAPLANTVSANKRRAFLQRLTSTVGLWIVLGAAMWFGYMPVVLGIAALLGIAGVVEFAGVFHHTDRDKSHAHPVLVVVMSIFWWACVLVRPGGSVPGWLDFAMMFVTLQLAFLLCYTTDVARDGPQMLRRILSSVFGVFYTVVLYGYLVRIILLKPTLLDGHLEGIPLLFYVIAVTKFSDMGAYAVGSWIGSDHFMCPRISPKKTWEGFAGAFVGGFLASCALLWVMPAKLGPITWTSSLALVPVLVLLTVTGDLAESILKRCLDVKDAGHKLPGIGGVLDLTDSLLYTTPVFYAYLMWSVR